MAHFKPSQYVVARSAGSAASITTTGITTVSGRLLVAVLTCFGNNIGASPVTDSKGNTWSTAIASVGTTQGWGAMFYVPNCTGGAAHTFTFTGVGSDFLSIAVYEIPGADISSPLGSTSSSTTNATTHSSGNITSGSRLEIFIGVGAISRGAEATPVVTTGSVNWFPQSQLPDGSLEGIATAFRLADAGVTDQFTYTTSSAFAEACLVAGFKQAPPVVTGGETATFFLS